MEIMELCQPIPGAGFGSSNSSLPAMFMGTLDGIRLDRNYSDVTANQSQIEDSLTGFMVGDGKVFIFCSFFRRKAINVLLSFEK